MIKLGALLASVGVAGALIATGAVHEAPARNAVTVEVRDLTQPTPRLDAAIRDSMNTNAYSLQRVAAPAAPGDGFKTVVELDGQPVTLNLTPHSVRSENFRVWVPDETGALTQIATPAPATFRGAVEGFDGSVVTATLVDGRLNAYVLLDGGQEMSPWMISPLADVARGADSSIHVVHRASDSEHAGWTCGVEGHVHDHHDDIVPAQRSASTRECLLTTEIAYDADFPFYQLNGSSVANTIADVEFIQMNVNIVYERDIGSTFVITDVIVRTSSGTDPYTSSDAEILLNQFRNHWNANLGFVPRDIAHLMTGRSIIGSTIGIAWVGQVCTNFGYGLSQSRFSANTNFRTALTAHEIGHNFSYGHCSGSACHIMCAGLNGCGGVGDPPKFGTDAINVITAYAESRPCIELLCNTPCFGDFNDDGVVNGTDLGVLLGAWGTNFPAGDANEDGVINGTDLGVMLGSWGACP